MAETISHVWASALVSEARTWIGTPWRHQGRLKGMGADCMGIVLGCVKAVGYPHVPPEFERTGYAVPFPDPAEIRRTCLGFFDKADVDDIREGDILLMNMGSRWPVHMGIAARLPDGRLSLIHSYPGSRRCVEVPLAGEWADAVVSVFRLKE